MMLKYWRSLIFEFFFYIRKNFKSVYRVVLPPSHKIVTLGYVHLSITNHIAALWFFFYLGPIISQHLDILYQLQRWGIAFLPMISCKKGATHKELHRPNILGSFGKCNGLWPSRGPRRLTSRFVGIRKVSR